MTFEALNFRLLFFNLFIKGDVTFDCFTIDLVKPPKSSAVSLTMGFLILRSFPPTGVLIVVPPILG